MGNSRDRKELVRLGEILNSGNVSEEDTEEDQIRALIDSIVDDPCNIEQFESDPGIMERIFVGVLTQAPEDVKIFFKIARLSRNPALFRRLVSWAINAEQADALAFLLLRSAYEWEDLGQLIFGLGKLMNHVKPETALHMLRAFNPAKTFWPKQVVDVDQAWNRIIHGYLTCTDLKRAYLALLWSGRGFRAHEFDAHYHELNYFKREFLECVKDWHANDDLGWRTYGRASKKAFEVLIAQVWQHHMDAGVALPKIWSGIQGFPVKILVRSGETTTVHTRTRPLPYSGLVARFIEGKPQTERLVRMPFLCKAKVAGARLSLPGAMLQQLIVYYAPREVGVVRVPSELSARARNSFAMVTIFDLLQRQ